MKKSNKYILHLTFYLAIFLLAALPSVTIRAQECVGRPECYEPEPPPDVGGPSPVETPESGESDSGEWEGYRDGRLNPQQGEYYTVWCRNNIVEVQRVVPTSEIILTVPLAQVLTLPVNGVLEFPNLFMTLVRNSEDTLTFYGSNGNRPGEAGEKAFSLSQCIERNTASLPPLPTGGAPQDPWAEFCRTNQAYICFSSTQEWCEAIYYADDACAGYTGFFYAIYYAIQLAFACLGQSLGLSVVVVGIAFGLGPRRLLRTRFKQRHKS